MIAESAPSIPAMLSRIGIPAPQAPTAAFLSDLQWRHLHSVPYENLDILGGRPLSLEIPDLFDKIVTRRRGGYCFELNALFAWLLRGLGYEVVDHVARFWRDSPGTPKRRHHVLAVKADGEWHLADVGVGGIVPRRPLRLAERDESAQGDECYRLEREARFGWFLMEKRRGEWQRLYSFTEEPQERCDFDFANFWCQHAPESVFRQGAMVALRTENGRNSIAGREFRLFRPGGVESFTPSTPTDYRAALAKYFGIDLLEDFQWDAVRLKAH